MKPQAANAPTVEPNALGLLKAKVADLPDGNAFRLEVEAISPTDTKAAILERMATLIRLSRRART
jgi:hypothetical protein